MTALPHVFLRTEWKLDGDEAVGLASENLPPKWFTKQPELDPGLEIDEMIAVIRLAADLAEKIQNAETPFEFWRRLQEGMTLRAEQSGMPQLLAGLGTSLVERSLLDAFCRSRRMPLARAIQSDELGIDLGWIHPELAGHSPSEFLPALPLSAVTVRHTVGLSDPLTAADLAEGSRLHDGLPETLEEAVQAYGLREFKIKICGNQAVDESRLKRIFDLLDAHATVNWAFSLDGNENYATASDFRTMWDNLMSRGWASARRERLLFVEQPVRRANALTPSADWRAWPEAPPLIIDESDGEPASLRTALELGYRGVSHKNCKGVFRGLANACLLRHRRRNAAGQPLLMSGEDLANIGPVALQQDLAVQSLLGNATVERNGHHYFRGLSCWPEAWQQQALESHPDLYYLTSDGLVSLRISQGMQSTATLDQAPFGVAPMFDPENYFLPVREMSI